MATEAVVALCWVGVMAVAVLRVRAVAWLGNLFGIPRNYAINLILDLLNSGIFIGILFF